MRENTVSLEVGMAVAQPGMSYKLTSKKFLRSIFPPELFFFPPSMAGIFLFLSESVILASWLFISKSSSHTLNLLGTYTYKICINLNYKRNTIFELLNI